MIGTTLGQYRIESKLGAGGMGAVYRAVDTRLVRPVALKVLAPGAIGDPDRRRRFTQEAKAASLLNHPNIVTIYDTGTDDYDGQRVDFIAMELVTGQTIESLIGTKGLELPDALEYAIQIADALAAAHAAGIIHRDLKPSNVMVNDQGLVKILDFGLAKMTEAQAQEVDSFAATEPLQLHTEEGIIIGTVAYMSPEQAEGKRMDARSDIFSFGSLLYEMLTGRKAFAGDSKMSMLSAVLCKEPQPLNSDLLGAPRELDIAVQRCLKKDPRRRWQTMADLRVALEEVLDEVRSPVAAKPVATEPPAPRPKFPIRWGWAAVAGLMLGLAPGAYLANSHVHRAPPSFQRLSFRRGDILAAKFAPGGSVVYSAAWDGAPLTLFSVQPGSRESRSLGLPSALLLAISKGGDMAILNGVKEVGNPGTLSRVPFSGGMPRDILDDVAAADWGPDGESLAVSRVINGRRRLEYPIGKVLVDAEGRAPPSIRVSPKGDLAAFFDYDVEVGDYSVAIAGPGQPKKILSKGWRGTAGLSWSPSGDEVWFSGVRTGEDPALYAVSLAPRERVLSRLPGWAMLLDIDTQGRALITNTNSRIGIKSVTPGNSGERDLAWLDASFLYELSGEADSVLFIELTDGEGRNSAIYLRKTDGSPAVKLGYGNRPALSPDEKSVLCIRREAAASHLTILPTGAGESKTLPGGGFRYESAEWFPDGKRVLFTGNESGHPVRTYVQSVHSGEARAITADGVRASRVSPDGRSLVIPRDGKLNIRAVEGGEERAICDFGPDDSVLRWSRDGQALFARHDVAGTGGAQILRIEVGSGRKQKLHEVKPPEPGANFYGGFSVSADGRSYAYSYQRDLAVLYLVSGLQ